MAQLSAIYQKVFGFHSCQGTYLGFEGNPQSGCVREATDPCFSLALIFLSFPQSLKINKNLSLSEDFLKRRKKLLLIL